MKNCWGTLVQSFSQPLKKYLSNACFQEKHRKRHGGHNGAWDKHGP